VVAGPGDRRDEDLRDIAKAVAGRFDHYICRRDDTLRGRAPDEVPKLIAATLRELGVREKQISVIPDEQEAIDAALKMGKPGDLVLVFADALTRSWKQVIKFHPEGAAVEKAKPRPKPALPPELRGEGATGKGFDESALGNMEGLIRDERGIRYAPEGED